MLPATPGWNHHIEIGAIDQAEKKLLCRRLLDRNIEALFDHGVDRPRINTDPRQQCADHFAWWHDMDRLRVDRVLQCLLDVAKGRIVNRLVDLTTTEEQ